MTNIESSTMDVHDQETDAGLDAAADLAARAVPDAHSAGARTVAAEVEADTGELSAGRVVTVVPLPMSQALAFLRARTIGEFLTQERPGSSPLWQRMGEARITPALQLLCAEYPEPLNLVALIGLDMPDTVGVLPLWAALARACPRAELRVISDEEFWLLQHLLGDDAGVDLDAIDLPLLLLLDEEYHVQAQWGPHPQAAEPYLEEWLANHPEYERLAEEESAESMASFAALNERLTLLTRIWYNSNLDAACCEELAALLEGLQNDGENGDTMAQHEQPAELQAEQ